MDFLFKKYTGFFLTCLCVALLLNGCLTYRIIRQIEGTEVLDPGDGFTVGVSTMAEVLTILGAPDEVLSVENKDLLIYERSLLYENRFSLGIPVLDVAAGGSFDVSAYGSLTRYDTLAFFFTPQGVLDQLVFEKNSREPYLRTLFSK